ncbi:hypothetical protein [Pseudomonas turukhanskensis]|uniref:hypothetical protein n=1 Tax=Pseudomonas turukhanskensis TaxID=1806536 RepID=UPI0022F2B3B3|nr:hypothetical protein [Pseudomonas turukhanskensis]
MNTLTAEEQLLTRLLPGDIEFFHSVPLPSMTRPFWLHIESLRSLFSPWLHTGVAAEEHLRVIRQHYQEVLSHPWCLGVSSHRPETLLALEEFVDHRAISSRLVHLPLPLPEWKQIDAQPHPVKPPLSCPRLLFTVSENHDADFFTCGGHRVLRAWQALCTAGQPGILTMACERPSAQALEAAGVDSQAVAQQTGRSLIWIRASRSELDALMANSHLFVQPADVLCTSDILRGLRRGCVPLIAAVEGSATLLQNNHLGLAVGSERQSAPWLWPARSAHDDEQIVIQLSQQIPRLLTESVYSAKQAAAQEWAATEPGAGASAASVWSHIHQRYREARLPAHSAATGPLRRCVLTDAALCRAFDGNAQAQLQINTGQRSVWSLGGYYVMAENRNDAVAPQWSLLSPYTQADTQPLVFAHNLVDLQGIYLPASATARQSLLVAALSHLLLGFPRLHSYCANWLRRYRRLHQRLNAARSKKQGGTHGAP